MDFKRFTNDFVWFSYTIQDCLVKVFLGKIELDCVHRNGKPLQVGDCIHAYGRLLSNYQLDQKQVVLQPEWEIIKWKRKRVSNTIPISVHHIMERCETPFDVSLAICQDFFQSILPTRWFPSLQLGLLLGLVSMMNHEIGSLHVLAVQSQYDPIVHRCLSFASGTTRSVRWRGSMTGITVQKKSMSCSPHVGWNSIVLVDGSTLTKKERLELNRYMTHKEECITTESFELVAENHGCVWALDIMPHPGKKPKQLDSSWFNEFSIVIDTRVSETYDEEMDQLLCDVIINGTPKEHGMQGYLASCSSQPSPQVSTEAQDFLVHYVTCLRKHGGDPRISLATLTKRIVDISQTHCLLCKRNTITMEDMLIAIHFLEERFFVMGMGGLLEFQSPPQGQSLLVECARRMYPEQDCHNVTVQYHAMYQMLLDRFQII
jgi:hypothetical protein